MAEETATIELPRGDPGTVSDAGASLDRVAGAFERTSGGVGRAVGLVGSWEGYASVTFECMATTYAAAAGSVDGVLAQARGAVARYADRLAEAQRRIRELGRQEEDCIERLRLEQRRLTDAEGRASEARGRYLAAMLPSGLDPTGSSMADQARAMDDISVAEGDARRAENAITREREELARLREQAKEEKEALEEAESAAAGEVRAAAGDLPDVTLAGGAVSPSPMAGTIFGPPGLTQWQQELQRAREEAPAEEESSEPDSEGGNAWDGFVKGLGDVKDEAVGLGTGAVNHVNVFNPDKLGETWSNDADIAKGIWDDPGGAAEGVWNSFKEPVEESYGTGGVDEAGTRGLLSGVAAVLGGKGLTKLGKLDEAAPDSDAPASPSVPDGERPSWQQSERDAYDEYRNQGYEEQRSFKDGQEVARSTKGSSRPEMYMDGSSIEVKNYNVETAKGRSDLVRSIAKQADLRAANLPQGTTQRVIVDVRGQRLPVEELSAVAERIVERTGGSVSLENIVFRRR